MPRWSCAALFCVLALSACDAKPTEAAPTPAPANQAATPTTTPTTPPPANSALTTPTPPAVAPEAEQPAPDDDDPTVGMTAGAKTWVESMRRIVPTAMCEQTYFKVCFDLGPGDCERIVSNHFESCLRTHRDKVPSAPNAQNGEEAGRLLGMCTGNDFEVALVAAGKGVKSAECDAERAKVLSATK